MTHQTSNPETHSLPALFAPVFQLLSAVHCSVPVTKIKKSMHLYLYKHMDEFTATLDIWRILPTNYYTLFSFT